MLAPVSTVHWETRASKRASCGDQKRGKLRAESKEVRPSSSSVALTGRWAAAIIYHHLSIKIRFRTISLGVHR